MTHRFHRLTILDERLLMWPLRHNDVGKAIQRTCLLGNTLSIQRNGAHYFWKGFLAYVLFGNQSVLPGYFQHPRPVPLQRQLQSVRLGAFSKTLRPAPLPHVSLIRSVMAIELFTPVNSALDLPSVCLCVTAVRTLTAAFMLSQYYFDFC